MVKKCLYLLSLIIVELRQSCILLLQPFKLPIAQQRIILHRLNLLFGILPIQFFNLTDNLHESSGDRPVLLLNPSVNTEYRRFTSDSWRLKIHLVIAERLRYSTDTVYILCHLFQFLFLFLKLTCLFFKFGLVFGNLFLYPGLLNFIFLKSDFAGSQRLLYFFKLGLRPEYLCFQPPCHSLQPLDCFLRLFRIFGQFPDIITFTKIVGAVYLS